MVVCFFMVGEVEIFERMVRMVKRFVMNFILIDVMFFYCLMVEEEKVGMLMGGGYLYILEGGKRVSG